MIDPLFDMFTTTIFSFSSVRFLNMCKPRASWPTSIDIYGKGQHAYQTGWVLRIQAGSVPFDQKFFLQMKFIIFEAIASNWLPFCLGSPLHVIRSLFGNCCLFQNAILHNKLKLGFRNFKPIFRRIQFSLVAVI